MACTCNNCSCDSCGCGGSCGGCNNCGGSCGGSCGGGCGFCGLDSNWIIIIAAIIIIWCTCCR